LTWPLQGLRASNKINERPSKRDCEAFFDFVEELSGETMLLWIAGKTLFVWSRTIVKHRETCRETYRQKPTLDTNQCRAQKKWAGSLPEKPARKLRIANIAQSITANS
jgi:hypothetical protein